MKRKPKKLCLSRETLRALGGPQLRDAVGGYTYALTRACCEFDTNQASYCYPCTTGTCPTDCA